MTGTRAIVRKTLTTTMMIIRTVTSINNKSDKNKNKNKNKDNNNDEIRNDNMQQ